MNKLFPLTSGTSLPKIPAPPTAHSRAFCALSSAHLCALCAPFFFPEHTQRYAKISIFSPKSKPSSKL